MVQFFGAPFSLTGLPNLIVQSNVLAGNPTDPAPRGVGGLVAASQGASGAVSDIVVTNFGADSLDLIFMDAKSVVGNNLEFDQFKGDIQSETSIFNISQGGNKAATLR